MSLFKPTVSGDDGWGNTLGTFNNSSITFKIGHRASGPQYFRAFVRMPNVTIQAGSTILTALEYLFVNGGSSSVSCTHYMNDADDAVAPTSLGGINGLAKTTGTGGSLTASPGNWNSQDITSEVQEVVDRTGWAYNNAMMMLMWGGASNTEKDCRSWDYSGTDYTPYMDATWAPPSGGVMWLSLLLGLAIQSGALIYPPAYAARVRAFENVLRAAGLSFLRPQPVRGIYTARGAQ